MNLPSRASEHRALEARLGVRLASALTQSSQALPHDVSERLRVVREQAVLRARQARQAAAAGGSVAASQGGGQAVLAGFWPRWERAASVVPLLMLVAGMLLIDHWVAREQVLAAAEIDTQLLSDNLPPAAYSDPGFAEYLRSAPPP